MLTKNAAYFEQELRPVLSTISDRTTRVVVEDLLALAKKKELEAEEGDSRPRPSGDEFKALSRKLPADRLKVIEQSAGQHVKALVLDLLAYVKTLS